MKKGFTLVELLAVITILGVVVTITAPIISDSLKSSKENAYERQKDLIIEAARSYMSKNASLLPGVTGGTACVNVSKLRNDGFLENKAIKNPLNNSTMNGSVSVTPNIIGTGNNAKVVNYNYVYNINAC